MLYVTSLDGSQVEPLINIGDDFKMEQTVDGALTVSFSCFPSDNNPGYALLQPEVVITVDDYDFKVKQFNDGEFSRSVTATSTFFELAKKRKNDIYGGTRTLNEIVAYLLSGTGWSFSIDGTIVNKSAFLPNFGNDNIVSLINIVRSAYECEYVIQPNKHIHIIAKDMGPDNEFVYRYKHNISDVIITRDTTNLFTKIRGIGAEGISVTYTSPNASIFGELEADPIEDEQFLDTNTLLEHIKKQIKDVPDLAIESTIPELTNRDIGERIWLIYEPMNVEMQTRIIKQTKSLVDGKLLTSSVIFGNVIPQSSVDTLVSQRVEINERDKIYRSRFEQTNNRILLEVEQLETSIASIDIKADSISLAVHNRITDEMAAINIKADQIQSSVTDVRNDLSSTITQTATAIRSEVAGKFTTVEGNITTINQSVSSLTQTASQLQSTISSQTTTINGLGTRITNAESSITQNASNITSKVSNTDYTGATITSLINQDAWGVKIAASKITLVGAVTVLSEISGNLGTITAGSLNLSTNATIGNQLNLGNMSSANGKGIFFSSGARIGGSGISDLNLVANNISFGQATLNFNTVSSINWGNHAPAARFG